MIRRSQSFAGRKRRRPRTAFLARKRPSPRSMVPYLRPGQEVKFLDTFFNAVAPSATGTILSSLNVVPQGVGESERLGRKITVKRIQVRFRYKNEGANAVVDGLKIMRFMLYQDKQTNGAAAAVSDLITSADYRAFRNLDNTGRFRILHDKYYTLNTKAAELITTLIDNGIFVSFAVNVNVPIEFDASADTGVIATQRSNNFGLMLIVDTTGHHDVDMAVRIRYTDN